MNLQIVRCAVGIAVKLPQERNSYFWKSGKKYEEADLFLDILYVNLKARRPSLQYRGKAGRSLF